jgi:hypothetical protein
MALAVGKAPSDEKVYDEKEGENWDKSSQKKWDKGVMVRGLQIRTGF